MLEVIAAVRHERALELVRAVNTLLLLEQCERATGTRWITDADRVRVSGARARYTAVVVR